MIEINKFIDHTVLKPIVSEDEVKKLCEEAKKYKFYAVCVNGSYVSLCRKELYESNVAIAAVVGFPLGASKTEVKIFEAMTAITDGADEIDMVINIGALKEGRYNYVEKEIRQIKDAIGNRVLKVIIETSYLTDDEKFKACELALNANADFVKTSTGFSSHGATYEDVILLSKACGNNAKIKASGGIKDYDTAVKYIELGAKRLGTSSGVEILNGIKLEKDKY